MSEFQKCPKCGVGESFRETALEWGDQHGVKIGEDGYPDYDDASSIEYSGPTEKAYYTCGGCGADLYIVDGKLITEAPKDPKAELLEACRHVRDNLRQESPEVWEHEIAHLEYAINKAEGGKL